MEEYVEENAEQASEPLPQGSSGGFLQTASNSRAVDKTEDQENHTKNRSKFENIEDLKLALKGKFDTVADAYVFFDILASGFITAAQFRRALIRLAFQNMDHAGLFQELNWKCLERNKVFEREFMDFFQWHTIDDRSKCLAEARIRREHLLKVEHNKAINLKAKGNVRPIPECNKLREVLRSRFSAITDFMVALDMDLTDVSTSSQLRVGLKRLGIQGVHAEDIVDELQPASLPPGMLRNSTLARVLKWSPIEDLQSELTQSRLRLTHQRATLELTHLPAVRASIREGSATKAFRKLLQAHFETVIDAFVFFDLDCSSELNRSKLLHGLSRMKHNAKLDEAEVVGDELVRELFLSKDSGIPVSEFISRLKWHDVKLGADLDQAVFDARKQQVQRSAERTGSTTKKASKPRPPDGKASQLAPSPRRLGRARSGSTETLWSPYQTRTRSEEKSESPTEKRSGRGEVHEALKLGEAALNEPKGETAEGVADVSVDGEGRDVNEEAGGSLSMEAPEQRGEQAPLTVETKAEHSRSPKATANGGSSPRQAGASGKGGAAAHCAELAWLDDKMGRSLHIDDVKRLRWARAGPDKRKGREACKAGRESEAVRVLAAGLAERGLADKVEAYAFFDSERRGRMTLFQMQRGLLSLRLFHLSVHDLPLRFDHREPAVPSVSLADFLDLFAPTDPAAAALRSLPDAELDARLRDALGRRDQIQQHASGAVGTATDRKLEGLRSRLMDGLSVTVPAKDSGKREGAGDERKEKVEERPAPARKEAASSSVAADNGHVLAVYDPKAEADQRSSTDANSENSGWNRQEDPVDGTAQTRDASRGNDSDPGVADGARRMSRAKEECFSMPEDHLAPSLQALVKPGLSSAETAGDSTSPTLTSPTLSAADGPPLCLSESPRHGKGRSRYFHSHHGGVAFRIGAEAAGDEGEDGQGRAGVHRGEQTTAQPAWTGPSLYRRLVEDGAGGVELDGIVERVERAGLERSRIGMLVTRLCEEQAGGEEGDGEGIGQDAFVRAFEDMEAVWQSELTLADTPGPSNAKVATCTLTPKPESGGAGGESSGGLRDQWARFDEGLDDSPLLSSGEVLATLEAQRVSDKEGFVRLDLGLGNWYEGQASPAGIPHGSGLLVLAPGDEGGRRWQVGAFRHGMLGGAGAMVMWDGTYYLGDFKNGRPHGAGVQGMVNGVVYEGEFRDGRRDGVGCMWVETGPAFFGEWVLGERHGRGIRGSGSRAWLRQSHGTWPDGSSSSGKRHSGRAPLPHSDVRTAIKFEEWVVVSSGTVANSSRHLQRDDRDQLLSALLWSSAQARSAACEGWSQGNAVLRRMQRFMRMRDTIAVSPRSCAAPAWTLGTASGSAEPSGPKRVLLPVADKFKRGEPPFMIPRIPIFNAITRHKPV